MKSSTEQDLVRVVLDYLTLRGVFVWRQNGGATRYPKKTGGHYFVRFTSIKGVSDILGVLPGGQFLAVELKHGKGRRRPDQVAFQAAIERAGGLAIVCYSLDELRAVIDPLLG